MSFTLIINSSNLINPNTNGTHTYIFIGGGFTVTNDMEVMLSSAQIPYSIFNITSAYYNNKYNFFFPTGSTSLAYNTFNITIPDGFYTIESLNSFMQQYAISNGLYLINDKSENAISRPGGTAGWLWNLRPGSRTLPPVSPDSQLKRQPRLGPTHTAARKLAFGCQGSKLSHKARRPAHTALNGLPRPRRAAGA
jgi:hypothetical protein